MKNYYKTVKDILSDPRKKSITMLIIMVIFFSLTVIGVRSNKGNASNNSLGNRYNTYDFSLNKIKSGNYKFVLSLNNDEVSNTYEGKRNNNEELFNDRENNYYSYNDDFYKDIHGVWSKVDFKYKELFNPYYIDKIIDKATFVKKEEFNDKTKVYNYSVSTTTLIELFERKIIDIEDPINTIILKTDSDNNVVEIDMDISSYGVFKNYGKSVKISIKYSDFGNIEKIENID